MRVKLSIMLEMVRDFAFKLLSKKFLIFLFFLVLSGGFWLLSALNDTYERDFYVPIRITNSPKNVVITSGEEDTIKITLKDKGFTLFAYMHSQQLTPLNFNFNTYADKNIGKGNVSQSDIIKNLYTQLYSSTRVSSIKPDKIDFSFNYGESRTIPVFISGNISPGNNRYLSQIEYSPRKVTVYASHEILDTLKAIYTIEQDIVDFTDTIKKVMPLRKVPGAKIIPSSIIVTLFPDVLIEESIEVPITTINIPQNKRLRTFPSKVRVHFNVGSKLFRNIRQEDFIIVANYKEIEEHPEEKSTIYILKQPKEVKNTRLEINQVDYLVEQQ